MNKKQSIAQTHGVDLNNFEPQNVTVKAITAVNILYGLFLFLVAFIFVIMAIINRKSTLLLSLGISLGVILFLITFYLFLDILSFKLEFKKGEIHYRHFFKRTLFNVSDIKCFRAETDSQARFYRIQFILADNKQIKYTISETNKANFILLLNLLKMGVEQK